MPLARAADVERRFGRTLTPTETITADDMIAYVSAALRRKVPRLAERIAAGEPDLEILARGVVVDIVLDPLRDPERVRSWQVDDLSITRDTTARRIGLVPTADDLAVLMPHTPDDTTPTYGSAPYRLAL